jgi:cytochrome c2
MPVTRRLIPLVMAAVVACQSASARERAEEAAALTGGDPARAPALMRRYGCTSCHSIPGIQGATGLVGPPLAGIASRSYIAGVLTNDPQHMIRWILDPKGVDSLTAMPVTGVSEGEARDIAAYLYTLR